MLSQLLVLAGLLAVTGLVTGFATLLVVYRLPADASVARRSIVKRLVIGLAHVVGIAGLVATGVWEPVLEAIVYDAPPLDPSVAGIGVFVLGSVVAVPGIVCSHLITAFQQVNLDDEESTARVVTLAVKDSFFVTAILALAVLVFVGVVAAPHPAVAILVPIVATFVGAQLLAYGVLWGQPIREPTDAERERIARALEQTGFPMERVHLIADQPEVELPRPFARGLRSRSHVFVPEDSLETMDPDVFETTLVQLTTPSGFRALRIVVRSLLVGSLVTMFVHFDALALYTSNELSGAVMALTVVILCSEAFGFVVGHRLIYRADQRVADVVGSQQLRTAMERQFERSGGEEIDRVSRYLLLLPSVEQRLGRLESGK
ncbi:hypothetical protein GCM10028857_11630 [Salinarchaeum chitinilyticum]